MPGQSRGRLRFPIVRRRLRVVAACALALIMIVPVAVIAATTLTSDGPPTRPKAIIIDQLSFTDPDPDFVSNARGQLEDAGYHVDYVPPQSVGVDFYRDLPKLGYDFVLIRSHSTNAAQGGASTQERHGSIGLFTNEPYRRDRYVSDQIALRLSQAFYPDRDASKRYFGITSDFVSGAMKGHFDGATVVLMGCGGLSGDNLARAFIERGAKVFVGWDGPVSAHYTDSATLELLTHLVAGGLAPREAVERTMDATGPDPVFGATLTLYP